MSFIYVINMSPLADCYIHKYEVSESPLHFLGCHLFSDLIAELLDESILIENYSKEVIL